MTPTKPNQDHDCRRDGHQAVLIELPDGTPESVCQVCGATTVQWPTGDTLTVEVTIREVPDTGPRP